MLFAFARSARQLREGAVHARIYFLRSRQRLGYFYLYANARTKYQQNVSRRAHCLAEVPAWVRFLAFAARLNLFFYSQDCVPL
jgi:hypothetical protein